MHFKLFECIWDRLVALQNSVQNGPNYCKSSCHEVASDFFCNEHTQSTPLDPKLIFGAFCTIWVHSGLFGCLKKLGAKRAELVQKFVPQSRIRIFRNEHTRTTPLYPKLMFWCIRDRLVALRNSVRNGPNYCKSSCHEVASEFFA